MAELAHFSPRAPCSVLARVWLWRPVSSPEVPAPGAGAGRPRRAGHERKGWNRWATRVEDPGGSSQVMAQLGQPGSRSEAGESCSLTGQQAVVAGAQGEAAPKLLELLAENPQTAGRQRFPQHKTPAPIKKKRTPSKLKLFASPKTREIKLKGRLGGAVFCIHVGQKV